MAADVQVVSQAGSDEMALLRRRIAELEAENERLREQTEQRLLTRVGELAALQKVNNAANSSLHLDATLALVIEAVAEVMRADVCSIFLLDGQDRLVLRATRGLNGDAVGRTYVHLGEGITGWAAKDGRPIAVRDGRQDPRHRFVPGLGEEHCRSILSVPIIVYTVEKLLGVLNIQTVAARDYTPEEVSFVQTVAGQIAIAIENALLYEQTDRKLRQKVSELTTLQRVSSMIAATLDLPEVLNLIVTQAVRLSKKDMAAIFELDESTQELGIIASHGLGPRFASLVRVRLGEGAVGRAVATGLPLAVIDYFEDPRLDFAAPFLAEEGIHSFFCAPLVSRGKTLGGLVVYSRERHGFNDEETQLISSFADKAAIALANARLYEEAQRNLAVKSALLSEMHHRVKNNLQTVASLLSLQARRAKVPEVVEPLMASVARVQSIATVHDLLSREQFSSASIEELTKQIIEVVTESPLLPDVRLEFSVQGGNIRLPSKEATVFALVLNELVSNAVAHGFTSGNEGAIEIMASEQNGRVAVTVSDDGVGLPPGFDLSQQSGLGLQIVQTLVETDLKGRFLIAPGEHGTCAAVSFPLCAGQ